MQYPLLFIEGILSFISPCFLPLMPVYLSYCAGEGATGSKKSLLRQPPKTSISHTSLLGKPPNAADFPAELQSETGFSEVAPICNASHCSWKPW